MRHRVKSVRLNRPRHQLKALERNLLTSVILYENVETTRDKAKYVRSIVDRVIARAKKKDAMNAIRYIQKYVMDENASRKIMEELVARFKDRPSGFTRIVNTRIREGDGAQMVQFQLLKD